MAERRRPQLGEGRQEGSDPGAHNVVEKPGPASLPPTMPHTCSRSHRPSAHETLRGPFPQTPEAGMTNTWQPGWPPEGKIKSPL